MRTANTPPLTTNLETVIGLARVMERVEGSPVAFDAAQYRLLACRLTEALQAAEPGDVLQAVLGTFRAAAEVYENLHYEHAGLCRSPLEASLNAELLATQAIARARKRPAASG